MTESDIERVVALTLQRLHPPTLLLIAEPQDYQQTIHLRLGSCDCDFRIALDKTADEEQWKSLGQIMTTNDVLRSLCMDAYHAVVIPFMPYSLAADIVNGAMHSLFVQMIHQALCRDLPVLALRYYCDPLSELNQLKGAVKNQNYIQFMQAKLATLKSIGVTLCTLDELIEKLSGNSNEMPVAKVARRYVTLSDLTQDPTISAMDGALLTDAASDYIRQKK